MHALFLSLALALAPQHVAAGDTPSVPELIAKVKELRLKEAEAKKARELAEAELRAEAKRQQDELDKLFGPSPDPKPNPPKPPEPVDPLRAKLRAAFDADPAQLDLRRNSAKDLAELYRQAAKLAADASVETSGDLLKRVKDASATLVGADALRECRRCVAQELGVLLPTDEPLTAEQRKAVADLFARLAVILDSLGG